MEKRSFGMEAQERENAMIVVSDNVWMLTIDNVIWYILDTKTVKSLNNATIFAADITQRESQIAEASNICTFSGPRLRRCELRNRYS